MDGSKERGGTGTDSWPSGILRVNQVDSMQEQTRPGQPVRFGPFAVHLRSGELCKNGYKIRLPDQPFQVLCMLLERAGEVVTRDEIRQRLWHAETFVDFDHGLNNAIKKLRDALNDSAESPTYIETLPKRGYRFICRVEEEARKLEQETPGVAKPAGWWRDYRLVTVCTVAALALLSALAAISTGRWHLRLPGQPAAGDLSSIAVLPLQNLSGDASQDYFAEGVTEALITELGRMSSLRIISHQSVLRYRGTSKPLPEIAKELDVDAVLEGSVLLTGDRVRITANLVRANPERHLWAQSYNLDLRNIARVQDEVARDVVIQVQGKLSPVRQDRLADARAVAPEAYQNYLLGRYHLNRGVKEHTVQAKLYFESAIEKDPNFAGPYAGLAELYARGMYPGPRDPRGGYWDARPLAKQFAVKALGMDETLADAHTALGWVALVEWDWAGADREFRRAIELNASEAMARMWYAEYLAAVPQNFTEAIAQAKLAQRLDPVSPLISSRAGWVYFFSGQREEARACWRKVQELETGKTGAALAFAQVDIVEGNYAQAINALERTAAEGRGAFVLGTLGRAYGMAGQRSKAQELATELEHRSGSENIPPEAIAYIYAGLGERDKAFAALEKCYQDHRWLFLLNVNPMLEPLRADPRFTDLARRVGLPAPSSG